MYPHSKKAAFEKRGVFTHYNSFDVCMNLNGGSLRAEIFQSSRNKWKTKTRNSHFLHDFNHWDVAAAAETNTILQVLEFVKFQTILLGSDGEGGLKIESLFVYTTR